jgi:hypothetical protein
LQESLNTIKETGFRVTRDVNLSGPKHYPVRLFLNFGFIAILAGARLNGARFDFENKRRPGFAGPGELDTIFIFQVSLQRFHRGGTVLHSGHELKPPCGAEHEVTP